MLRRSHHYSIVSALLAVVFAVCLLCGCSHSIDPRLKMAESIMEEHPDSALIILADIDASKFSHSEDIALYGLLLTHARYKNFIDETNDSIISASAEYFLKQDDKERSARALFLKGMIQMNANRLGEAAVSFTQAIDIAKESKQYMWEGQCARGLFFLYRDLMNGSEQIRYAEEEYASFQNTGNDDWINYAGLDLATAYNNNGKYDDAKAIADKLRQSIEAENDSTLLAETHLLLGICDYATCNYMSSLYHYSQVYMLDSTVFSDDNIFHISNSLLYVNQDSISSEIKRLITALEGNKRTFSFIISANQGDYKEAYQNLMKYKNEQENVLVRILRNNVAESLKGFQDLKRNAKELETRRKKEMMYIGALLFIFIAVSIILWYRTRLLRAEVECHSIQATLESLKADFLYQTQTTKINNSPDLN